MQIRTLIAALLIAAPLAQPAHAIAFGRVDHNGDGAVTPEEASRHMRGMKQVHLDKCDHNKDGVIDQSEFGCLHGIYDATYRRKQ